MIEPIKRVEELMNGHAISRQANNEEIIEKVNEIIEHLNKPAVLASGAFSDGQEEVVPTDTLRSDVNALMEELAAEVHHGECFYNTRDFHDFLKLLDDLRTKSLFLHMANAKGE